MEGKAIPGTTTDALTSAEEAVLEKAFTVANTSPPTISGVVSQGQPLTVDEGTWVGAPSAYAYAWSRCDSTGSTCTPTGATTKTYVPVAADSGETLRVAVTASNSVSSAQASSPVTAVVP